MRLPPLPSSVNAARVPETSPATITHRACPVCNGDDPENLAGRPDGLTVARCPCGMVYLPEAPDDNVLAAFYESYGEAKGYGRAETRPWILSAMDLLRRERNPHLSILRDTGGVRGTRLLELGCAFGAFLRAARSAGANVAGVEMDETALAHLASLGIPAGKTIPPGPLDIVCAFQLLEHLRDPGELCAAVARTLVPDGRLLVAVPNGGEGLRVGPTWIGYRVDLEHLNYFSIESLSRLLAQHGLYVEQFWEHSQPALDRGRKSSSLPARVIRRVQPVPSAKAWGPRCKDGTYVLTALARRA